jgi:tetratricopeptide (TPR) repeat protein
MGAQPPPQRAVLRALALALALATVAVLARSAACGFVNYDDQTYVTRNPRVQVGLTAAGVRWALTTFDASNWHPLTWLSLQADAALYGLDPRGYHLSNVLLHAAASALLFLCFARMTGALGTSLFMAALFAWHPAHVESVAWVAERKDVLSGLFAMLSLWSYARYTARPSLAPYLGVAGALALGMMAKPMLVTWPFVLMLLDRWPLARTATVREKLPLMGLAAGSALVTLWAQAQGGAVRTLESFPLTMRIANALLAYTGYLRHLFWPRHLAAFYPAQPHQVGEFSVLAAALVLAGVTLLVLAQWRPRPYLAVGWLWYVGMLVPVTGLVQVGEQAMADRYTYLPFVGLFIMAAWAGAEVAAAVRLPRPAVGFAATAVVFACRIAAASQVETWRDSVTLWTHALEVTGPNATASHSLGEALMERAQYESARIRLAEAARMNPRNELTHYNLGIALTELGRKEEALREFQIALRLNPRNADVYYNLGIFHDRLGERDRARPLYEEAIRLRPEYWQAHINLGADLFHEGRLDDARGHFERALQIKRPCPQALDWLGTIHARLGELPEAVHCYEDALRADPRYAAAREHLRAALRRE